MKLSGCAEQILNIYNYYSGAIMINRKCIIEYYFNNRKDVNTLSEKDVVGKSLFEIYPELTYEQSTMLEVMRTGKPIVNTYQQLVNYKGERYGALCDTFPVFDSNTIIGSIEIFFYQHDSGKNFNITLVGDNNKTMGHTYIVDDIVSASEKMSLLKERVIKVSNTDSTVLIYGETGTGKELFAQAIHANGKRRSKRFISQNCAAIPENLLESILFGTVKGGYTDAENRMGLFEAANGGTLFLDEINSMDISVQAKLLKTIEEQKLVRIGGIQEIPVDVRIIAATNKDPKECVEEGMLREDLYYRLKVVQLNIPPLRERIEDVEPLTRYYVEFFNNTMGKCIKGVTKDVIDMFKSYTWPGNVRELRNMLESGFNLADGEYITLEDLDIDLEEMNNIIRTAEQKAPTNLKQKIRSFEKYIITSTMNDNASIIKASEALGISRQTLSAKLKELDMNEVKN